MISKLMKLKQNDVISIVGSGGKTSLMYALTNELRDKKTLLSTTTHIFNPPMHTYDFRQIGQRDLPLFLKKTEKGVYLLAKSLQTDNNKLSGFDSLSLQHYTSFFDYSIIESDGSKQKPLKGWNDTEPVILPNTTKTIGVINLSQNGQLMTPENIHRLEHFMSLLSTPCKKIITFQTLRDVIFHQKGLFKSSIGDKILFINQIDTETDKKLLPSFWQTFSTEQYRFFQSIIYGSLQNKAHWQYKRKD